MQEAMKIADEKKREKMEDRLARQRVKEQIARDKAERSAKTKPPPSSQPPAGSPQPAAVSTKKEYDTCRLQVGVGGA